MQCGESGYELKNSRIDQIIIALLRNNYCKDIGCKVYQQNSPV